MPEPQDIFGEIGVDDRKLGMKQHEFKRLLERGFDPSYSVPIHPDDFPYLFQSTSLLKGAKISTVSLKIRRGGPDEGKTLATASCKDEEIVLMGLNPKTYIPGWIFGLYVGVLRRLCDEGNEGARSHAATQLVKMDMDKHTLMQHWTSKLLEVDSAAPQYRRSRSAGRPIPVAQKHSRTGHHPRGKQGDGGRDKEASPQRKRVAGDSDVGQGRLFGPDPTP